MNRKILKLLGIGASILALCSCSGGNESGSSFSSSLPSHEATQDNILVAYFSRSGENYGVGVVDKGNTAIMAENINSYLKGTLFEIEPVNKYPEDYEEATNVAREEKNSNARPAIKNAVNDFDSYDTIFVGYPIWYSDYPMIINTFLESYDFEGKTIIPFNTHEGSGNAGTFSRIKSKMSSSTVLEGLSIRGSTARQDESKNTIKTWLIDLGFETND